MHQLVQQYLFFRSHLAGHVRAIEPNGNVTPFAIKAGFCVATGVCHRRRCHVASVDDIQLQRHPSPLQALQLLQHLLGNSSTRFVARLRQKPCGIQQRLALDGALYAPGFGWVGIANTAPAILARIRSARRLCALAAQHHILAHSFNAQPQRLRQRIVGIIGQPKDAAQDANKAVPCRFERVTSRCAHAAQRGLEVGVGENLGHELVHVLGAIEPCRARLLAHMLQQLLQLQLGQTPILESPHRGRVHSLVHEDALCRVLCTASNGDGVALASVLSVDGIALFGLADVAKLNVGRDTGLQKQAGHLAQERVFGAIGHHAQHVAGVLAVRDGTHHRLVLGSAGAACGVGGEVQPYISIIALACLNRLKQIVESLYHWAFFSRGQVGIALGIFAQCLPLIEAADIGQKIIAIALQSHLVDNVILKTTCPALDDATPIPLGRPTIQNRGPRGHG